MNIVSIFIAGRLPIQTMKLYVSGFEKRGNLEQKIIFELRTAQNVTQ